MSSSKYANLPDIDTAQDVYETEDVLELGSRRGNFEDDDEHFDPHNPPSPTSLARRNELDSENNGAIDQSSLPGIDALSKRFGALASQTYTLYPSSLPFIHPHLPSSSLPSDPSASLEPTPEHPRARIRRLRYEMEELEKELADEAAQSQEAGAASSSSFETKGKAGGDILKELRDLKGRLVAVAGNSAIKDASGGWEGKLKQLGNARANEELTLAGGDASDGAVAVGGGAGSDEKKVGELDKRLAELEEMIGVGNSGVDLSDPLPTPLLPTLQKLEHLLTLLTQPRHLDAISRRVKLLLIDLDKAAQSSSSSPATNSASKGRSIISSTSLDQPIPTSSSPSTLTPAQQSSLTTLFALLPRLQPLLPLVPHLLARLRSLSSLHASAGEFASTLTRVEGESGGLKEGEREVRGVLERLEENVRRNEEVMEGNLRGLGGRVDRLVERLEALGVRGK